MRIGVALVVISDLIIRFGDLEAHYTNQGLWPTELIPNFGWNPGNWSLHTLNGSYAYEAFLFALHFISALFLLIGFKTRLSGLIVWLLLISLHNRNIFVLQGGDDLLRILLFWGLFLPWNAHYSLDARKNTISRKQRLLANLGYLLLVFSVYFFSALLKSAPEWHAEGSAYYYALSLEQIRLPMGDWLYHFPRVLKLFTWCAYYLELLVPFLILWPSKKQYLRGIAFVLLFLLHLGIGLTLYVGLFYIINMVAILGLLPASVMDKLDSFLRIKQKSQQVLRKQNYYLTLLSRTFCGAAILICLFINVSELPGFPYEPRKEVVYPANVLRLNQYWGMFSPGVLRKDGWFVYHGMDSIGRQWDLRRNEDYVDYKKPEHVVSMYKTDRWRKLAENMQSDHYTFLRPLYGKYILRKWNKDHPEKKLAVLNIYFMEKENLPDYKTTVPVKILHCVCYAN